MNVPYPLCDTGGIIVEKLGFRPITSYSSHINKEPLEIKSRILRELLHKSLPDLNIEDAGQVVERLNIINARLKKMRQEEKASGQSKLENIVFVTADISSYFTQACMTMAGKTIKVLVGKTKSDGWSSNMKSRTLQAIINRKIGHRVNKYETRFVRGKGYGRFRGGRGSILESFSLDMGNQHSKIGPLLLKQRNGTAMGSPLGPIGADFHSVTHDLFNRRQFTDFWNRNVPYATTVMNSNCIDDKIGVIRVVGDSVEQVKEGTRMVKEWISLTFFKSNMYPGCVLNLEAYGNKAECLGIQLGVHNGYTVSKVRSQGGLSYQSGLGFASRSEKIGRVFGQIYRATMSSTFWTRTHFLAPLISEITDGFRRTGYSEAMINSALQKLKRRVGNGFLHKKVAF